MSKKNERESRRLSTAACVTSNVGLQQHSAAGAYPSEAVDSKTLEFLRQAALKQLLAMLVDGVYSRDRKRMDLALIEGAYEEDVRTEIYTRIVHAHGGNC